MVGGNCVTEELTLPGFQHDSCGTAHVVIQDSPMLRNDELGLGDYGLEYIHPEIVVHCHSGVRSLWAAQHLREAGFRRVLNLTGGIDRWSDEVDPSVPKY